MEKEFSYEEGSKRVEEIIALLEKGDLPMTDATKLFTEGQELIKKCFSSLENAKGKLTEVKENLNKLTEI